MDTACSSSLVATHLAVSDLQKRGRADQQGAFSLAAGANTMVSRKTWFFGQVYDGDQVVVTFCYCDAEMKSSGEGAVTISKWKGQCSVVWLRIAQALWLPSKLQKKTYLGTRAIIYTLNFSMLMKLQLLPSTTAMFKAASMLSPDGRCKVRHLSGPSCVAQHQFCIETAPNQCWMFEWVLANLTWDVAVLNMEMENHQNLAWFGNCCPL